MNGSIKGMMRLSALSLAIILSTQVNAAGYRLEFQSASVLADSGEAAVVEDAGTNFYNAAGLVYLPKQVVISAIEVYAPTRFSGNMNAPSPFGVLSPTFNYNVHGHASAHTTSVLPAYHFSLPLNDRFAVGFSMMPTWGFVEYYGGGAVTRYDLQRVYTKTLELSPSVAMKLTNELSLGFGPDFNYFSASSKNHVRTQGPVVFGGTIGDSIARFSGERWTVGGHVGALYSFTPQTRLGLSYRSRLNMYLRGHSTFTVADRGPFFETDDFKLRIPLPATTFLSFYHDVTPCWAMMGTIAFDQWAVLQNYHAKNIIQPPSASNPSGNIKDVVLQQKMHDTMDFSVGTHYKLNDRLLLRANFKYIQTPTISRYRDINFPDGDKYGFQIGGRYVFNPKFAMDLIYGHVFVSQVNIHNTNPVTHAVLSGRARTHIDLFGGQFVVNL